MADHRPATKPNGIIYTTPISIQHGKSLPSISQALSQTPFSSILPFDPEIVPIPRLAEIPLGSRFAKVGGSFENGRSIEALRRLGLDDPSCEQFLNTKNRLTALLRSQNQLRYSFKAPDRSPTNRIPGSSSSGNGTNDKMKSRRSTVVGPLSAALMESEPGAYQPPQPRHTLVLSPPRGGGAECSGISPYMAAIRLPMIDNGVTKLASKTAFQSRTPVFVSNPPTKHAHPDPQLSLQPTRISAVPGNKINGRKTPPTNVPSRLTSLASPSQSHPVILAVPTDTEAQVPSQALETPVSAPVPQIILQRAPSILGSEYLTFPHLDAEVARQDYIELAVELTEPEDQQIPRNHTSRGLELAKRHSADFNELVELVLQADDQTYPSDSPCAHPVTNNNHFFEVHSTPAEDGPGLKLDVIVHLNQMLRLAVPEPEYQSISVDNLVRLQSIAQRSLEIAALQVPTQQPLSDENEQSGPQWMIYLSGIHNALQAAHLLLRLQTADKVEKRLLNEENVRMVVTLCIDFFGRLAKVSTLRSEKDMPPPIWSNTDYREATSTALSELRSILLMIVLLVKDGKLALAIMSPLEYLAIDIFFLERPWMLKRGNEIFNLPLESLKNVSADVLTTIFTYLPSQREYLLKQVLANLGNLQSARQNARSIRLSNGSSIQLVSKLLMKLVQASALVRKTHDGIPSPEGYTSDIEHGSAASDEMLHETGNESTLEDEADAVRRPVLAASQLKRFTKSVHQAVSSTVQNVTSHIFSHALNSPKSSDSPYRNLLESFIQDFGCALGVPGWSASEALLRSILTQAIHAIESDKSSASIKATALDLLGAAGNAISQLSAALRQSLAILEQHMTETASTLLRLAESSQAEESHTRRMLNLDGPFMIYAASTSNLESVNSLLSADRILFLMTWSVRVTEDFGLSTDDDGRPTVLDEAQGRLAWRLQQMLSGSSRLTSDYPSSQVNLDEKRAAYLLAMLQLPFCRAFERILLLMLSSMNVEQTAVRSKSLRMLQDLLEKDPSILDRGTLLLKHILNRTTDPSPMVRQSVMNLLTRCQSLRPGLRMKILPYVIERTVDAVIGVRKPAVKMLRDTYSASSRADVKFKIIETLLGRVRDQDAGVAELARHVLDDAWLLPILTLRMETTESVQLKMAIRQVGRLIVHTAEASENLAPHLLAYFRGVLAGPSTPPSSTKDVCRLLVVGLLDDAVEDSDDREAPSQAAVFRTLTIFARAAPKLLRIEQLQLLEPYVRNISRTDDLATYRAVIVIFRCVLPTLSSSQETFLRSVQGTLLGSLTKLGKRELKEVVPCLWIINKVLNNVERLERAAASCLKELQQRREAELSDDQKTRGLVLRYIPIVCLLGMHCQFTTTTGVSQASLPVRENESVASVMIRVVSSFCAASNPMVVRRAAIEGLGWICYGTPILFSSGRVMTIFKSVFEDSNTDLEDVVLRAFSEYLSVDEKPVEQSLENGKEKIETRDTAVLEGAITSNKEEGIASSLAHTYLSDMMRIALSAQDEHASLAVEIIASIYRQGLAHPKECGPVLAALTTSDNHKISETAGRDYRALYPKYESLLERENGKTIELTCEYLSKVAVTDTGLIDQSSGPKLRVFFDILRSAKPKPRKKYLLACVSHTARNMRRSGTASPLDELRDAFFLAENLALNDYSTIDDQQEVVHALESAVMATGPGLLDAYSSIHQGSDDVVSSPNATLQNGMKDSNEGDDTAKNGVAHQVEIRNRLMTSSARLLLMWYIRSHLRRLYNLGTYRAKDKDFTRQPSRLAGVTDHPFQHELEILAIALRIKDEHFIFKQLSDLLSTDADYEGHPTEDDEEGDHDDATRSHNGGSHAQDSRSSEGGSSIDFRPPMARREPSGSGGGSLGTTGLQSNRGKKRRASTKITGPLTPSKRAKSNRPVAKRRTSGKGGKRRVDDSDSDEDSDGEYGS